MTVIPKVSGLITTALALVFLGATAQKADAAFVGYICDDALCTGGGDTIVTDQGFGDNFPGSAIVGEINLGAISVGGFTIVTNISSSKPLIGSSALPQLDISFSAFTTDNLSHTVFLYASDTDFTGGGSFVLSTGGTQAPGADGDKVTGRVWGGTSNTNLDLSNLLAAIGPTTDSPFTLSGSGQLIPVVNPFGLTLGVEITRGSAGATTGDINMLVSTPEPASWALLGVGLIGLACIRRRSPKVS